MKYTAVFDFGTTAVKGALIAEDGQMFTKQSVNLKLLLKDGYIEQDPQSWVEAFKSISNTFFKQVPKEMVANIIMSGQMQDVILVDKEVRPLGNVILYSDGRAVEECKRLRKVLGEKYLNETLGNVLNETFAIPKIAWIKEHEQERFENTFKVLFSPKDLIVARMTGAFYCDTTTSATTGGMNLQKQAWDEEILDVLSIPGDKLPKIYRPDEVAGMVTAEAEEIFGYNRGTKVYVGIGDAGASFFASGLISEGQFNVTWGTTGQIGLISSKILPPTEGLWNLPAMTEKKYINVVPILNAGNVHKWIASFLGAGKTDYAVVSKLLQENHKKSGLLCLPYLTGERFPIVDPYASGSFVGVTPNTTQADFVRASLEGVCFSVRQAIEALGVSPVTITLIGGGAKEKAWCQMLADILDSEITVLEHAEFLPAVALAGVTEREPEEYDAYIMEIQEHYGKQKFYPKKELQDYYNSCYKKYLKLYPALRNVFETFHE